MAVLLVLVRQAFRVRSKETRGLDTHKHDHEPLQESLLSESSSVNANQPSVRRLEPAAADLTLSEEDEEAGRLPPADLETDSRGQNGGSMRETRPLLDAMACLVLFAYSSFASHAIRLLNCVQVGDKLVLRYAGAQKCNFATWQAPIVLLVALLTAMPVFPIAAWGLSLKRMEGTLLSRRTRWARMSRLQAGEPSFLGAIARFAAGPFVSHHWHWAFVLLLQRLLTVMCSALATTGVETSVGVALVSFVFLLLQMLARPYRLSWVNALQTCSNICLVTLAILNSASGAFLSTGFDPRTDGDATLRHFQTTLEVLMVLALFPPPLVYMWHAALPKIRWCFCCRCCMRGRQRLPDRQRFILDLDEESDRERDGEQGGAHDEIDRLRSLLAEKERLLAACEAEKEEKERLLAASEAEKKEKERLLAASEAQKEEKVQLLAASEAAKERLLAEIKAKKEEKEHLLAESEAEKE